jgi:hypothetical protein
MRNWGPTLTTDQHIIQAGFANRLANFPAGM